MDGYQLSLNDIRETSARLLALASPEAIKEEFSLDSRRADIILAGSLLVEAISEQLQIEHWQISGFGLREGFALDTYERTSYPSSCSSRSAETKA